MTGGGHPTRRFGPGQHAYAAWQAAERPAELHIYAQGGHGFGMRKLGLPVDAWTDRLADWMSSSGWIGAS